MIVDKEILKISGATSVADTEIVQSLWSGYGEIRRYFLKGGKLPSVIVKHIKWPNASNHPRGWNTKLSHLRKQKSYQVEKNWYSSYASQTDAACRVPHCFHSLESTDEIMLILEDLDASAFHIRLDPETISLEDAKNCLSWLANFHAKFMHTAPEGLWPIGTYWHLDTRPDELDKMQNDPLKKAAKGIDKILRNAKYQTLVHGDAKLANLCFNKTNGVAAVDFQYVGKGCGIKDVAYFLSSCFDEDECEKYEEELLSHYFHQLEITINKSIDFQLVKEEWSFLYKYAWADFYRFLDGWNPGHWKMHAYSERLTNAVIRELEK
ncbi:phosphotransferase [Ekhidna sp. To15]|uniref:phosphotransferase n=1 Tax=Ekhidna sp. To15 TaxID=3395267 RepID=UPI003F520B09